LLTKFNAERRLRFAKFLAFCEKSPVRGISRDSRTQGGSENQRECPRAKYWERTTFGLVLLAYERRDWLSRFDFRAAPMKTLPREVRGRASLCSAMRLERETNAAAADHRK
jgi:hypothetical protein